MIGRWRLSIPDIACACELCFNLGQWTWMNGVAVPERRLPDSRTDLQRRVFGVVDVSPHVFGIRDFRKHL